MCEGWVCKGLRIDDAACIIPPCEPESVERWWRSVWRGCCVQEGVEVSRGEQWVRSTVGIPREPQPLRGPGDASLTADESLP